MQSENPTAMELKQELWAALKALRGRKMAVGSADAIASMAREMLRCVRAELAILQAGESVTKGLTRFARSGQE